MPVRLAPRPRLASLVAAGIGAPLLIVATAAVASAHGAPLDPVSRSAACGSAGRFTQTAACRAARAGDGGRWFEQWDNLRVASVNGRDRQAIPDGRLCSGGLGAFGGLDLARSDWPSTSLRAGRAITVSYRGTIPHAGTFRMYVTRNGYNPKQALRWADLEATPFLTAKDPAFSGGAYRFQGTLPTGKVGRHILYTIWQNSSTPDTYYSCSDVVFAKPAKAARATKPAKAARATTAARPTPTAARPIPTAARPATTAARPIPTASDVSLAVENLSTELADRNSVLLPTLAGAGLLVLAGSGGAVAVARRGRRRKAPRRH